ERTGVAQGMSGSPVYFDGRLAGAVAFTWPFAQEPIAGITPIGAMRDLSRSEGASAASRGGPSVDVVALVGRTVPPTFASDLVTELTAAGNLPQGARGLSWVVSGLGLRPDLLAAAAGPGEWRSGGRNEDLGEEALVGGAAVAAVLIEGDLQLAAVGTVTERYGDEILAFGHPFLGAGTVRVPMAPAEVVTVLASRETSFKIGNVGAVVGAFDQDRLAGVHGRIGLTAPTVPLEMVVHAGRRKTYHMGIAPVPQLIPGLLAAAVQGGMEAVGSSQGVRGIELSARFEVGGREPLELRDSFTGSGSGAELVSFLAASARFLQRNPFEDVEIEKIHLELVLSQEERSASLVAVRPETLRPRAGRPLRLDLELVPFRGRRFIRQVTVELPGDLPSGRYTVLVGDGRSVDRARLAMEPARPANLGQALDLLGSLHSRRQLVVLGSMPTEGLRVVGELLPRLPPSIRSLWTSGPPLPAVDAWILRSEVHELAIEDVGLPFQGLARLALDVRRGAVEGEGS
ncbi:MAG: hypothetical protein PVG07_11855, partial [Acidobacteriota bacterium]